MEKIEFQLQIFDITNNPIETHCQPGKIILDKYLRRESIEISGISVSTNKTKVCVLIEKVTGVNVDQHCLESCHPLPSDKKNPTESVLRNKNQNNYFNNRSIDIVRSLCHGRSLSLLQLSLD